ISCICVGFHQDAHAILDVSQIDSPALPIVRRHLGGGTVYLDEHQWFYECIFHKRRAPKGVSALYDTLLTPVVNGLQELGLDSTLRPPNEIEISGNRIAGTGAGQIGEAMVVVGNILLDFPPEKMARLWKVPSEAFRSLALDGLDQHITTLRKEMTSVPSSDDLAALMTKHYARHLGRTVEPGVLSEKEEHLLAEMETLLVSREWVSEHGSLRSNGLKISARAFIKEGQSGTNGDTKRMTVRLVDGKVANAILSPPNDTFAAMALKKTPAELLSVDLSVFGNDHWTPEDISTVLSQIEN
ncbi:MAG: lipoate--protein ligase family protein, partial [Gemmatimonadota bacterium]|nr:lipoate--protein ligase family protein [Gemmatimonadota bacterium]